ncbi:MAG: hypothetical protein AAGJ56_00810 [Myxococcota bacterium]
MSTETANNERMCRRLGWLTMLGGSLLVACGSAASSSSVQPGEPRREAMEAVERAESALNTDQLIEALRYALEARAAPLGLDQLALSRRVDRVIERIATQRAAYVASLFDSGDPIAAVQFAQQLASIDRDAESWADQVVSVARREFIARAGRADEGGYPGHAAIQLSFASELSSGEGIAAAEKRWSAFCAQHCFAPTLISVKSKVESDTADRIRDVVSDAIDASIAIHAEGALSLAVSMTLERAELVDEQSEEQALAPYPGDSFETEEVYYEEVPSMRFDSQIEYDRVVERVERRDCAPRPGKRGCRRWTESVEKQVPRQVERSVLSPRRVRRVRPRSSYPRDRVVVYPRTRWMRAVTYVGTLAIAERRHPFAVHVEAIDRSHAQVDDRGVSLAADPVQLPEKEALWREADQALTAVVKKALVASLSSQHAVLRRRALESILVAEELEAEESFLAVLAAGGEPDDTMVDFFDRRYHRSPTAIAAMLFANASTHQGKRSAGTDSEGAVSGSHSGSTYDSEAKGRDDSTKSSDAMERSAEPEPEPPPSPEPGFSSDSEPSAQERRELEALEKSSIEAAQEADKKAREGGAP